ncbi:MAG: hypothetical protein LAP85_14440 [Acidobacteriia bacterium]|nr:hypothetical protein [Terriglobia bacterium]
MVAILALLALGIMLLIEIWRQRRRERREPGLALEPAKVGLPEGSIERYLHPGHGWVLVHKPRLASVGVDDFAARFVGRLEAVEVRKPGTLVLQGEPLVTLRRGRRSLTLMSPLSGILMDVNTRLSSQPSLVNDSPYDQGWIARVSPARLDIDLMNLLKGPAVQRWRESIQERLSSWFAPRLGIVLQDGGQWSENMGELLNDEDWEELVKMLFPLHPSSKSSNPKPVTE